MRYGNGSSTWFICSSKHDHMSDRVKNKDRTESDGIYARQANDEMKVRKMRDEILFNCEKEIMEANLFLMCNQKEEGVQAVRNVLDVLMKEIATCIQPITKNTEPYVIVALRTLAKGLEIQMSGKWENTIRIAEAIADATKFDVPEEKSNETDNEEPCK